MGYPNWEKGGGGMNITPYMKKLEATGYTGELLDRAVVLAGGNRLLYQQLLEAVDQLRMTPVDALHHVACREARRLQA